MVLTIILAAAAVGSYAVLGNMVMTWAFGFFALISLLVALFGTHSSRK
jgi:hypothetical protein